MSGDMWGNIDYIDMDILKYISMNPYTWPLMVALIIFYLLINIHGKQFS